MDRTALTRRTVLTTAALATTTLAAPFVRGAYAAGKLSFGTWDHWVPGASEVLATIMKMIAQVTQSGKSINAAMDWAESEIEGFMRS